MVKVFLISNVYTYRRIFDEHKDFTVVDALALSDLVVFLGGEDVHPSLYGQEKHQRTWPNMQRDLTEEASWEYAKRLGKPCVGICRGGQFLNIMNGGSMYQHVDNHSVKHELTDQVTQKKWLVTSTHHQMMKPNLGVGEVVATARESTSRETMVGDKVVDDMNPAHSEAGMHPDIEVIWYKHSKDLCFQPHPEHANAGECREYFFELINRYILTKEK